VALEGVFGDRIVSCGLWSACLLDLTPCNFYLCGNLKDKVCRMNPHTEEELKKNLQRKILEVFQEELLQVNSILCEQYRECLSSTSCNISLFYCLMERYLTYIGKIFGTWQ
jgi:hypothetical protein